MTELMEELVAMLKLYEREREKKLYWEGGGFLMQRAHCLY